MNAIPERSLHLTRDEIPSAGTRLRPGGHPVGEVVEVPVQSLRAGRSPRLNGIDRAHVARLAETEAQFPPILVDRRTMQVIDGMHRLMVARQRGCDMINVVFFDGSEADAFLRAVKENVMHGLPLSQADRRASAERIIASHPHLSDRAIGQSAGLAAETVATIRKRLQAQVPLPDSRVGMDGRVRPLDSGAGRLRAAELLAKQPEASLRSVAREAGISPTTAQDVRRRLERGEPPVPARRGLAAAGHSGKDTANADRDGAGGGTADAPSARRLRARTAAQLDPAIAVQKLLLDPSLRNNDHGKRILRLLHSNAVGAEHLPGAVTFVPMHCAAILVQLSSQYAQMWEEFARELDKRTRIIAASASGR